jgi:RNA polymerase subunit RPABC4/transcription elongation factor Spt4
VLVSGVSWQCAACGELVGEGQEVCPSCGAAEPGEAERRACPNCDAPVNVGDVRCSYCGWRLDRPVNPSVNSSRDCRPGKIAAVLAFVLIGLPAGLFGACSGAVALTYPGFRMADYVELSILAFVGIALFGGMLKLMIGQFRR